MCLHQNIHLSENAFDEVPPILNFSIYNSVSLLCTSCLTGVLFVYRNNTEWRTSRKANPRQLAFYQCQTFHLHDNAREYIFKVNEAFICNTRPEIVVDHFQATCRDGQHINGEHVDCKRLYGSTEIESRVEFIEGQLVIIINHSEGRNYQTVDEFQNLGPRYN